eukprot:s1009_g10.t1
MGWSWSLFFYQRLLESCALEAGLLVGDRIEDRTHSGLVSPGRHVRAQYVDNFFVCGTEPSAGQGKLDAIVMILRVRGFKVHEIQNASPTVEGHTHGGQLWPIQALAAHSSGGYLSGLYRLSGGKFLLYVSDGLVGSYITRVRILSRAELTMAVLHTAPCEVCDKRDLLRQATFGLWLGRVAFMFGPCMLLLTMLGGCCRLWRGRSMCVKPGNGSSEPSPALAEMARSPLRSRGGVRRVRQGAFQATICFCRLMVRSATTHCHLRAKAFHAVLARLYELAMAARGSSTELQEDHIAWATEIALAESGLCEADLRPSYAAVVSSGCLAGVIESPTTSSLTQALAWRWRLGLAREHGWTELQKVWVEVLREARPGGSRPLSAEKAVLRVRTAWQRQASRRQAISTNSEVRLSRRVQRLAASNLRRCAAADARLKELVTQAGKRWEGILRRAAGGKGNAKRRRSDSCQPRQT